MYYKFWDVVIDFENLEFVYYFIDWVKLLEDIKIILGCMFFFGYGVFL